MARNGALAIGLAIALAAVGAAPDAKAGDPDAGKAIFEHIRHQRHAAPPYTGRIGVENLPKFLANPKGYKPTTAMTFPGLRHEKDIDDVIAYITAQH